MIHVTLTEWRRGKYAYWQASWYDDGKRRFENVGAILGRKAISRREAERKCREIELRENTRPTTGKAGATKLSAWLDAYASGCGYGDGTRDDLDATMPPPVALAFSPRVMRSSM